MGEEVSVGAFVRQRNRLHGYSLRDKLCKAPNVNEEACADFLKGEFLLEGKAMLCP